MKTFIIYGADDDLIEIEGVVREEHDIAGDSGATVVLSRNDGQEVVHILVRLSAQGCWYVAPVMADEDTEIPEDWHFTTRPGSGTASELMTPGYSMVLFATVADDVEATIRRDDA